MRPSPDEPTAIETVAPGLWRVPLETLTLPPATRTNTYVWQRPGGLLVVDPGSSRKREVHRLVDFLETTLKAAEPKGHPSPSLLAYLITHHHPDHWGGLPRLLRRLRAPVVVLEPGRYKRLSADFRAPEWLEPRLAGGRILETPGHASDHLALQLPSGDVLAGDLVAGLGTVVIDPPDGDMAAYLASLETLRERGVSQLFPAHGPTITDGPAALRELLAHRAMRERQVLEALEHQGPATPMGLVPHVYPDLSLVLRPVAARSLLAHLIKLQGEGRAEQRGRRWRLS